MPSFAGTTTVFGRFKRNASAGSGANNNVGPSVTWTSHHAHNHHRRDSSILSLQTSLADIGTNVKRSVSLRSHRTNLSSGGSSLGKHTNKSPSSGNAFLPLSSASPIEDEEGAVTGSPQRKNNHEKEKDTSPLKEAPALKRKISLTAKGLSHKFKSTEALPKLDSPVYLDNVGRSRTDNPLSPFSSMLVGSGPGNVTPAMSRKPSVAPSDASSRPGGLHPQSSFSRDGSSTYSSINGAPLSHVPSAPHSVGGPLNPNTIYAQIQETSAKRMATIDYVRKLHEGDIFYFSTLHYSAAGLSTMPSLYPHKLGRRATNYFILGYSLPALLDMNSNNALEYLKALSLLLAEFETYQTLAGYDASGNSVSRGRVGQMFKSGMGLSRNTKGRRSSTTTDTLSLDPRQADLLGMPIAGRIPEASSPQDTTSPVNPTGHEFAYLLTPALPFDPDFNTTLGTLCDTLIDTYAKLMDLVSSPEICSPAIGTEFSKADKAIRKILVANVVREFEDTTRAGVKGEVASLGKLVLGGLM
ncbi:hypothetical protein M409DRAFT_69708 [Zasmidium cellare ATCC 36951]|uniref:Uncharacterized protein n=1 Tax=Zasmidium cellare ATCC 36951 TaxID=1080233 RepID=A0A6A6C7C5_ZASCE|nr:uncharacterized protein M409DRAFT_69708 [Zasmidium cellare ATCC 36951]KAF2161639.1 hypothetical protein M409DRAFT_69708 [Zasmidium cellare ATCC 36951]